MLELPHPLSYPRHFLERSGADIFRTQLYYTALPPKGVSPP
jgi:hypothetical protein